MPRRRADAAGKMRGNTPRLIVSSAAVVSFLLVALWPHRVEVGLTPVADGFRLPTFAGHAGDGSRRLFVVEKQGTIRVVLPEGRVLTEPFLDIRARVEARGFEQGLSASPFTRATGSTDASLFTTLICEAVS